MEIKISKDELSKRKLFLSTPMYGGNCSGMFARSLADLSATCLRHGIELKMYFLFNESLITRGRNYCCDEFLRSDSTHFLFIDSDIGFNPQDVIAMLAIQSDDSPYDVLSAPYPKKCLHHSNKVMTEQGLKTISWIVNNKYEGAVPSYTKEGKLVWAKVTNHWKEPNANKKWVSLRTSNKRSRNVITVTDDHEVAFIDNLFDPKIDYIRADQTKSKYVVTRPTKNSNRRYNSLYNKQQLSVLVGTALGDGSLNSSFGCNHGPKQKAYVHHKAKVLNANIQKNGLGFSIKNAQTEKLSELIGKGETKTLKNVLHLFDEISLAYLYMDDGNLYDYAVRSEENGVNNWWVNLDTGATKRSSHKPSSGNWIVGRKVELRKPTSGIATMCFSVEDNKILQQHLKDRFDLDCKILYQSPNKFGDKYPFIVFDSENTEKLHKIIHPYIHETMEYKLREDFRGLEKIEIDTKPLDFSAIKIVDVVKPNNKNNSYLYDIEVEDTHNFIANEVLVHNCISWEKIKAAVDKGLADENPNNLEKYVGDYVFNPVGGQNKIPLGEPVEVAEAGTGFMMIRRKTFEEYDKHYPKQKYKPDHVRTEHFDGSREIMAYFDCIIDPETKRYLSEDYMFCYNVRKMGLKVWFCPWMKLQHVGTYVFGGSLIDIAQAGVAATADSGILDKYKDRNKNLKPPAKKGKK